MNWKEFGRKHSCPNEGTVQAFAGRTKKNQENFSDNSWCPDRDSNSAPSEYESNANPLGKSASSVTRNRYLGHDEALLLRIELKTLRIFF
jgi:hypothetical protein